MRLTTRPEKKKRMPNGTTKNAAGIAMADLRLKLIAINFKKRRVIQLSVGVA